MKKGFTLIELLIVVAIAGILMAIAIPQISQFVNGLDCHKYHGRAANIH